MKISKELRGKMKFILASGSPRRKELLNLIVNDFDIIVSCVEEKIEEYLTPEEQVTNLAYIKARDVFDKTEGNRIVIGADTMVVKDGVIYGKPKDEQDAYNMIKKLISGDRTHDVITGLCVIIYKDGEYKEYKTYDKSKEYLKEISDEEINRWIGTGKAMDKAGSYGINTEFGVYVEKIEGNYNTIVGLPIHKLYDIIKQYIYK